jgi:hypothetical protein
MTRYRIHRMKPNARESFRWAAHTGGTATVKEKDYEPGAELDAPGCYAAWKALAGGSDPLAPGDLLEDPSGKLLILKYIGFEPASWLVPETNEAAAGVTGQGSEVSAASGGA